MLRNRSRFRLRLRRGRGELLGELVEPSGKLRLTGLRFGTSSTGLTGRQLKQITYNGEVVSLNAQGYLRHAGGLVIILL